MPQTVIGMFNKRADAMKAVQAVRAANLGTADVNVMPAEDLGDAAMSADELKRYHEALAHLLAGNMDGGDPDFYAKALQRGATLVAVGVADADAGRRVVAIMKQFDAVDTDKQSMTRQEAADGKGDPSNVQLSPADLDAAKERAGVPTDR